MAGEIIGEKYLQGQVPALVSGDISQQDLIQQTGNVARLAGGFVAAAAGGDVNIGAQTGGVAAENNAIQVVPIMLTAAFVAKEAGAILNISKELDKAKLAQVARKYDLLPQNPDELSKRGYRETSHPDAAKAGYRTFENSITGDKLRFDRGKPGASGFEGIDHYHRYNPEFTKGNQDLYLTKDGQPCAKGCKSSHILPGDK